MSDEEALELGTLALDTKTDRVGQVMARQGGRLYLRAVTGGREWEAEPADVRSADATDELRARVSAVNADSGWGR
ncbi:hypothetical protein [Streptomyces sp. NBC_01262]|uniref:hypothetical protein n=1 Tax=Streptomyces sp. NBC_01262 TaxID=2903803 RepID=UPI002E345E1A|nr:hypothetical protein [Streptomyces sp. NBC_01262]